MTTPRAIRRQPLSVQIAERLREDVLSGLHAPGAQLNELELSAAFGVSRGPLREAIQRLVQEGLLRSEPHRGLRARPGRGRYPRRVLCARHAGDGGGAPYRRKPTGERARPKS